MTVALAARGRRRGALTGLALVLLGVACGRAVVEIQAVDTATGPLVLGAIAVLAGVAAMFAGPVLCLAAIPALTIVSPVPPISLGSGVDVTVADAFFLGLAGWWALHAAGFARRINAAPTPAPIRSVPILLFLGYAGLTLLQVASVDPGSLSVSSVSWLRVVQTACLGWLAATFIRTYRDVSLVLGAIALAGSIGVVMALVGAAGTEGGPLGVRGGGALNANTLGLVSGFLILLAFFPAITPRLVVRLPLAVVGCVGLVQSASVASLFGTVVALVLGLTMAARPRQTGTGARLAKAVTALVLALAMAYGLSALIRPENLPTSDGFFYESTGQRIILGTAGLEIAADNPIIGVGWHRSSNPEVIGDPEVTTELRARFRDTRNDFFPDVEPLQVHSTYAQVSAELGGIGVLLLGLMFWSVGRDVTRVARAAPRGSPEWDQVLFLGWALVLSLMWLNDNPIFGGQIETVALAIFVGAIAGLGRSIVASAERRLREAQAQPVEAQPVGVRSLAPSPSSSSR